MHIHVTQSFTWYYAIDFNMPSALFSVANIVHSHFPPTDDKECNQLQQISTYHCDPLEEACKAELENGLLKGND